MVKDLSDLKNLADKMMEKAQSFLNQDYTSELAYTERELASASSVHTAAVMAVHDVSAQMNTTNSLNATVVGAKGDFEAVEGDFEGIRGRVDAVTTSNAHVLILLNHTEVM